MNSYYLPILFLITAPTLMVAQTINSPRDPVREFETWDTNSDERLTPKELPDKLRKNFDRVDRDGDGFISLDEHLRVRRGGPREERDRPAEGYKKIEDLSYAANDNPRQMLDLYLPENIQEKLPVLCWIHGGGWKNGSKRNAGRILNLVKSGKFAGVSIGYRLSDEAKWPAQIHDCKAAIRWIRANAERYHLDSDRIAVWGSSAGGHLVAMLGVSQDVEGLEGKIGPHLDQSSAVSCVVDFFGPTELLTMDSQGSRIKHDAPDSPEGLLIGGAIQEYPDKARSASPISHVTPDDSPFLIVHGTEDALVPYEQSVEFEKALESVGVFAAFVTVDGGEHGGGFPPEVQAIVEDFLAQQLLNAEGKTEDATLKAK